MPQEMIYTEICDNGKENILMKLDGKLVSKQSNSSIVNNFLSIRYWRSFIEEVFLPRGFPDSVHSDYIVYQLWDTVQAFASTILGTLTTHSILQGIGVGESTATPLAAAISWILKDGTGMIGRILFAWWTGPELDAQSKKWRLFADVLNDVAMGLELMLPYFSPSYITSILCLSTCMKSIVGVAGGATRAALTQHQALTNNLADVSAKDGSQETLVNLLASFFGIFILSITQNSFVMELYLLLVVTHIYANYSAVKALKLNSLNEDRLAILISSYAMNGSISDVGSVNREESVLLFQKPSKKYCGFHIKLGVSLNPIIQSKDQDALYSLEKLSNHFRHKTYLILPDIKRKEIYVALRKEAQSLDLLNAYFDAYFYGLLMTLKLAQRQDIMSQAELSTSESVKKLYVMMKNKTFLNFEKNQLAWWTILSMDELVSQEFKQWCKLLKQSEWNHENNYLLVNNWRADWG